MCLPKPIKQEKIKNQSVKKKTSLEEHLFGELSQNEVQLIGQINCTNLHKLSTIPLGVRKKIIYQGDKMKIIWRKRINEIKW